MINKNKCILDGYQSTNDTKKENPIIFIVHIK